MDKDTYRARRREMGMTQAELAAALGVTRDTVIARERGRTRVIAEHFLALDGLACKALENERNI